MPAGQVYVKPPSHTAGGFVVPPGGAVFSSMAPDSLDDLVSPSEAAARIGAASSTVRSWAARGYLKPTGLDEQHRPLYLMIDVLRTARETRRRAIGARRTA